jgi:phage tail sheath gpL-like
MPIEFQQFPSSWRLPLYWVEIDSSKAGTGTLNLSALLVGQMSAGSTAVPNIPVSPGDLDTAIAWFGEGSMLSDMFATFFENNTAQELWCIPVSDPVGVAATGTIHVTNPPSQAGTLVLFIAGQQVPVGVGASDSAATVAANIVTAINETTTLPVTAALGGTGGIVVEITCKWVGLTGNDISIGDTLLGAPGGEALPIGLTLSYSGVLGGGVTPANFGYLSGGTGVPSFTTAIANLGDSAYEYVALPYTDSTSLLAWQTEYGFTSTGRWGWLRQQYGQIYSAFRGIFSAILTFGATQNAPVTSIMATEPAVPSPIWEVCAAYCAQAAIALTNDPARPLQTLALQGVMPAARAYRFPLTEANILSSNGMATQGVNPSGLMAILRETTTYQLNAFGAPDDAYTDMTTPATLSKLLRNQKAAITTKFPRYKLADDGTLFGPGQAIVTPSIIKAEIVSEYAQDEFNGLVEDARTFAQNLIVERDSVNPDRVNVLYPPNLIGQLRIFAVLAQFRLLGTQQTTVPQS